MTRVFVTAALALSCGCGGQATSLTPPESSGGANTGGASGGAVSIGVGGSSAAGTAGSLDWGFGLHGLAYGKDRLVAVGTQQVLNFAATGVTTGVTFVATTGLDWRPALRRAKGQFRNVVYGNGRFVAASDQGPYVSEDGVTWQPSNLLDTGLVQRVAFGNGMFVTSNSSGYYRSEDGVDWTNFGPATAGDELYFAGGHFLSFKWMFQGDEPPGGEFARVRVPGEPSYFLGWVSVVNDRFRGVFLCCQGDLSEQVRRYGTASSANGLDWDIETWDEIPVPPMILLETAQVCLGATPLGPLLAGPDCSSLEPIADDLFRPYSTLYLNDLYIAVGVYGIVTSTDGVTWQRTLWTK